MLLVNVSGAGDGEAVGDADGDGVGEAVVAWVAGATISSSASMAANTAATVFSSLPRRRCDGPLGVLLKLKTSTGGWSGLRLCNRCEQSGVDIAMRRSHSACDTGHPVSPMLQREKGCKCRWDPARGRDPVTTM